MTRHRKKLLELFEIGKQPLNAHQAHEKIIEESDKATVYRGLQYLEREGYLSSFVFECHERGIERYYFLKTEEHIHFMHCELCHNFIPFSKCPLEKAMKDLEVETGFVVEEHYVTLKGLCSECAKRIEK